MAEALPKNFIDYEEYPQTADIQNKCVNMIARLYHAPTAPGEENAMGTRFAALHPPTGNSLKIGPVPLEAVKLLCWPRSP